MSFPPEPVLSEVEVSGNLLLQAALCGFFTILLFMKQKIPGILFLLAMPLSVLLYIKVEAVSGSEILGLFAAVALYVVVGLVIALLFNRKDSD
jgi:hypothetical protein